MSRRSILFRLMLALLGAWLIVDSRLTVHGQSIGYTPPLNIDVRDEGSSVGRALALNFTGAGVTCTFSATVATCDVTSGGGGAPDDAEYVVGATDAGLSAERLGTDTDTVDWDFGTAGQAKLNALAIPRANTQRWYYCCGTTVQAFSGSISYYTEGTVGYIDATSSEGFMHSYTTAASTGSVAMVIGNGNSGPPLFGNRNNLFQAGFKVQQSTNQRVFVGLSEEYQGPSSSDPATNLMGLRWDTGASDTNFQCISNDDSGGGSITDSGVAVTTSTTKFEARETNGVSVTFYINGALVCTHASNLPSSSTGMYPGIYIRTLANEAKEIRRGSIYGQHDK